MLQNQQSAEEFPLRRGLCSRGSLHLVAGNNLLYKCQKEAGSKDDLISSLLKAALMLLWVLATTPFFTK